MSETIVYGTRNGAFCIAARKLLSERGVDFKDVTMDDDEPLRNHIRAKSKRDTVPQIWINERHVGGYSDLRAFDSSGKLTALVNDVMK